MTSVKTLTTGLLLGCLAVGTYAALVQESPAQASRSIAAPVDVPASPEIDSTPPSGSAVGGNVVEVIQVPSYTYLRLESEGAEELWVAVSKADVRKGQSVRLAKAERMENFTSKQLGRTFPVIYFGALDGEGPSTDAGVDPHGGMNPHDAAPGQRSERASLADLVEIIPSERAEGENGHRIADLFAQKSDLADKKVRLRATVVQVTMNVMGTNFVHVRDGSGKAEDKTHDVVLKVAEAPPAVGEQALFEGILRTTVDLGAGYTYPVLIEDAAVVGK